MPRGARGRGGAPLASLPAHRSQVACRVSLAWSLVDLVRVRLDLAYDGTDFAGWAYQHEQRTVQGELEKALAVIARADDLPRVTVAGRTDAGVHATGQVAH